MGGHERRWASFLTGDNRGFLETAIDDGRPLLILSAVFLIGCGVFAIFQAATGHFLPHDTVYLGMTASQLCELQGCRILHFMIHDRISFAGVLVAIGVIGYLSLTHLGPAVLGCTVFAAGLAWAALGAPD